MSDINNRCEEWLQMFEKMWAEGAYYTAWTYLGSIFEALSMLPETSRQRWAGVIKRNRPSGETVEKLHDTAQHNLKYLDNVVSCGGTYIDEEILLVLTARHNIELIKRLLQEAYDIDFALSLGEVDELIKKRFVRMQMSRASRKLFHRLYLEKQAHSRKLRLL